MHKIPLVLVFSLLISFTLYPNQADTTVTREEKSKSGWSFGAVPAIAYDSDIGFKIGAVVNFYHYGDGTLYPDYKHSLYFEWSITTKGSGINQFIYDSKYLIPGVRFTGEASYLTERALDFYGFNGYEAFYDSRYEDDDPENSMYISRVFYRQERKLLRLRTDFKGKIIGNNFKWIAGFVHYGIKTDTVNIDRLNKGKSDDKKLPAIGGGLYGNYINWGVIPADQKDGGNTNLIKLGLEYDSRDNEPNPMKGIWTEALVLVAPEFLGNSDYSFSKLALTHRQYFTILPKRLSFVYRLGYQMKLSGEMPYYMLPFVFYSGRQLSRDGLGGAKTLRGILRNRVVGEDYLYGNIEVRWKFLRTMIFNQNIYLALSGFIDFGQVTNKYKINISGVPEDSMSLFSEKKESLHTSLGGGVHAALNQNFVVAVDYGIALDSSDGKTGLYIGLNWLF